MGCDGGGEGAPRFPPPQPLPRAPFVRDGDRVRHWQLALAQKKEGVRRGGGEDGGNEGKTPPLWRIRRKIAEVAGSVHRRAARGACQQWL